MQFDGARGLHIRVTKKMIKSLEIRVVVAFSTSDYRDIPAMIIYQNYITSFSCLSSRFLKIFQCNLKEIWLLFLARQATNYRLVSGGMNLLSKVSKARLGDSINLIISGRKKRSLRIAMKAEQRGQH